MIMDVHWLIELVGGTQLLEQPTLLNVLYSSIPSEVAPGYMEFKEEIKNSTNWIPRI